MKQRIWELDALRGLCVLGMIVIHFVYDLVELYGLVRWDYSLLFSFVKDWGGVLFLLISGICVTLGSRHLLRGTVVLLCGFVCTAVTWGMYKLGMADKGILIYFGVLHCLGVCMLLWSLLRKLPTAVTLPLSLVMIGLGLVLRNQSFVDFPWLVPFGFVYPGFVSSDYFPLLPNLGFFLLGSVIGNTLYKNRQSLLPRVNPDEGIPAFLRLCGKNSLWIYLLHQPLLSLLCMLLSAFR